MDNLMTFARVLEKGGITSENDFGSISHAIGFIESVFLSFKSISREANVMISKNLDPER